MNAIPPLRITEPGIYNIPSDAYHADPCPTPSLSAGMINDILVAPAKCRENSIRLNPDWEEPEGQEKFTIGSVSHVLFLEPHLFDERVVVVKFDDWRKNDANDIRAAAQAVGKTAILKKHMDKVIQARDAFLSNEFTRAAFQNGRLEQSMFWRHPVYGFWCRARPDCIADTLAHLCDYKATADARPERFGKHAYDMGYHRRAAWYLDGAAAVLGKRPAHYWFCPQETKRPYLAAVVELTMGAIEAGRLENDTACAIFNNCLNTGEWYGYRHRDDLTKDRAFQVDLPPWAYMQIEERVR